MFVGGLPGISANSNKNYRRYNFEAFANVSRNIKFPENLQPYTQSKLFSMKATVQQLHTQQLQNEMMCD